MKRFYVLLFTMILLFVFVSCGESVSTSQTPITTAPLQTTPADTTTAPIQTPETTLSGVDILYGQEADRAIDLDCGSGHSIALEKHHASLDYHWALVIKMLETENAIYEELVSTEVGNNGTAQGVINADYRWVVSIDGLDVEIKNFSFYHEITHGYVRMDLGADFVLPEFVTFEGYDVWLRIYDTKTNEVAFYAWFTDYHYDNGLFLPHVGPPSMLPSHEVIGGEILLSGPEGYEAVFDRNAETYLCAHELATPIVWRYAEVVTVDAYAFWGSHDDAVNLHKVPSAWKLYGSLDGHEWNLIAEEYNEIPEEIANYSERYGGLSESVTYQYFKLEINIPKDYPLSSLYEYRFSEFALCREVR